MGGRGSGGGRGGGGGASAKQNELGNKTFDQVVKEKLANMTDDELKKTLVNTKNAMNKATANLAFEQNKLRKMNAEFENVKMFDSDYESKSAALEKQIAKVSEAQSFANARTQIHYLAVNEKYNVRDAHVRSNLPTMTNGQLNSY